jgi:tellurite methyltransferase
MPSSQAEWDEKHRLGAENDSAEPAGIVYELWPLLPPGAALDLACGTGRNALFLAERGRHVTAVDRSGAGLEILEAQAQSRRIPVGRIRTLAEARRSTRSSIDLLQADLEKIELPANCYAVILCVRYLQRSLFPQICGALGPGGMLLFETYTKAQLDFSGGPRNPAHLLDTGELRKAFPELSVVFYRELSAGQGIASLAARKPRSRAHSQNGG